MKATKAEAAPLSAADLSRRELLVLGSFLLPRRDPQSTIAWIEVDGRRVNLDKEHEIVDAYVTRQMKSSAVSKGIGVTCEKLLGWIEKKAQNGKGRISRNLKKALGHRLANYDPEEVDYSAVIKAKLQNKSRTRTKVIEKRLRCEDLVASRQLNQVSLASLIPTTFWPGYLPTPTWFIPEGIWVMPYGISQSVNGVAAAIQGAMGLLGRVAGNREHMKAARKAASKQAFAAGMCSVPVLGNVHYPLVIGDLRDLRRIEMKRARVEQLIERRATDPSQKRSRRAALRK